MSLVCGYGIEPDWLLAQTDGSSVRSHHFLLPSSASSSESSTLPFAVVIKGGTGLPEGFCFSPKVLREMSRLKHYSMMVPGVFK